MVVIRLTDPQAEPRPSITRPWEDQARAARRTVENARGLAGMLAFTGPEARYHVPGGRCP